ncbi:BatA and WFA domain-containing protein [Labilibaculum sp.]|uniref:vWA domain-containing protein n=1 Tax=Labilibaculum sp. TaxID=2060723 RepID=UPI002AA92B8F|nr:BatA and WFA domain-containing protein [Labilibaculum sp.]MBN2596465.1 BatA and WFA domain-containing protein [Marinifilaceae bacterium]
MFHFLHPEILWTLLALLFPIIIHLFNFKRFKKIYFSNLKFLKNLNIENKRRSKVKKWLLLLLRLLALACIIIAFSQPYIPSEKDQNKRLQQNEFFRIYIDNSFSMNAETESGNALETAKNKAIELINSYPNYSKIRIYSNHFFPFSSNLNKQQAIARVMDINPSPLPVLLSEQIKKIQLNNADTNYHLYVFSDFQKTQSDIENIEVDSTNSITFLPLSVQQSSNLLIDSCWFDKPYHQVKQSQELFIRLVNTSNQNYQKIPIKLSINDSTKSISSFDIDRNSKKNISLKYVNNKSGIYQGMVEINDFPITYDNKFYFSYSINDKIQIGSVNQKEPNKYLNKLFSNTEAFEFKNHDKSSIFNENPDNYQLLILNEIQEMESGFSQTVKNYLSNGGHVLFIPNSKPNQSVNEFLDEILAPQLLQIDSSKQKLSIIELNSELYQNVFKEIKTDARLPDIYQHYKLGTSKNNLSETIWKTQAGDDLLIKIKYGNGNFYQLSMQLNPKWTNLITHPIFVPTFINLTRNSNNNQSLYYTLGNKEPVKINSFKHKSSNARFHIINKKNHTDIIPDQENNFDKGTLLYTREEIIQAENYLISRNDSIIYCCSFNYSRIESDPEYFTLDELKSQIKSQLLPISINSPEKMKLSDIYNEQSNGKRYWKHFVLLCILLTVSESLLHRTNSNNNHKPATKK